MSMKTLATLVMVLMVSMVCAVVWAGTYGNSWKYSPSDLSDSGCIQDAIDEMDTRLDAMGATNNTSAANILLKSNGYMVDVGGTNGGSVIYLNQSGSFANVGQTTATQAFPVAFIATPQVFIMSKTAAGVTNAAVPTVSTSSFTYVVGAATNFDWSARGRIR